MVAFLIARLPSEPKSLAAVQFMQNNGIVYRISTNVDFMNFVMTTGGGESLITTMGLNDNFEIGQEEALIFHELTSIFPPAIMVMRARLMSIHFLLELSPKNNIKVEPTDSSATENLRPCGRVIKQEVDTSIDDNSEENQTENDDRVNEDVEPAINDAFNGNVEEDPLDLPVADELLQLFDEGAFAVDQNLKDTLDNAMLNRGPETGDENKNDRNLDDEVEENDDDSDEEVDEDEETENTEKSDLMEGIEEGADKDETKQGNHLERSLYTCPCKNCMSSYKKFEELEEHVKRHKRTQEFFCDVCKKIFALQDEALAHIKQREKKKCCKCQKKSSRLILHLRCHTGERPFACKTCDRPFTRFPHLERHMLQHTGTKPFSCEHCGKGFFERYKLKIHACEHAGDQATEFSRSGRRIRNRIFANISEGKKSSKCDAKFHESRNLKKSY